MKQTWMTVSAVVMLAVGCGLSEDNDTGGDPVDGFIGSQPAADITSQTQLYAYHPRGIMGTNSLVVMSAYSAYLSDPTITCPAVVDASEAGTTDLTFTGGCTDDGGTPEIEDDVSWSGTGRFYQDATTLEMSGEAFSFSEYDDCDGAPDTRSFTSIGTETITTDAIGATWDGSYMIEISTPGGGADCAPFVQTIAVSMGGTIQGLQMNGIADEVIYDTSGQIGHNLAGRWTIETVGLTHPTADTDANGSFCAEPVSGAMQIRSGGNIANLEPDGATDCTPEACLWYTLNGEAMPSQICGIAAY